MSGGCLLGLSPVTIRKNVLGMESALHFTKLAAVKVPQCSPLKMHCGDID